MIWFRQQWLNLVEDDFCFLCTRKRWLKYSLRTCAFLIRIRREDLLHSKAGKLFYTFAWADFHKLLLACPLLNATEKGGSKPFFLTTAMRIKWGV